MKTEDEQMLFDNPFATFKTTTDIQGKVKVDLAMGDFPAELFCEWERECETRYNGMRWLKAWCDHVVAHNRDVNTDLVINEVLGIVSEELEKQKKEQPKQENEKKPMVSTLSGKYG